MRSKQILSRLGVCCPMRMLRSVTATNTQVTHLEGLYQRKDPERGYDLVGRGNPGMFETLMMQIALSQATVCGLFIIEHSNLVVTSNAVILLVRSFARRKWMAPMSESISGASLIVTAASDRCPHPLPPSPWSNSRELASCAPFSTHSGPCSD